MPQARPIAAAEALVREWLRASVGEDVEAIAQLDVLLEVNAHDQLLYCEILPKLPTRMLERYGAVLPERLSAAWEQLVVHTAGELPLELCARLAHLHARVFTVAVWKARSEREIALVVEAIVESFHLWWYAHPKLLDGSLAPAIEAALRS